MTLPPVPGDDWHEAHWLDSGHVIDLNASMSVVMEWLQRVAPVD